MIFKINLLKTNNLKLQFLGIIPQYVDKTGKLNPEQISALSALLTFKGKSVKSLLQETINKGQDLKKKVQIILNKSSLRGHASVATTPTIAFWWEGSKFLDSMLTGIVFSSSLMASGRRTSTTEEDIIYPASILKNKKAYGLYKKQSLENLNCHNWLLKQGVAKDEASKALQYGIYDGIRAAQQDQTLAESIICFIKEWETEKEWLPEEAGMLIDWFKKNAQSWGIGQLLATRVLAPRDIYPYPNIFKDPRESNLARETKKEGVVSLEFLKVPNLVNLLKSLKSFTQNTISSKSKIIRGWPKLLALRRQICRDYNLAVNVKVLSRVPWRIWGEKKRHRTVPQVVDSIYYSIATAIENVKCQMSNVKSKSKMLNVINKFNTYFSIPPHVKKNPHFLKRYTGCLLGSLDCYQKLIKMGIKPREAIFIIPRGIKIRVLSEYNLYNLISGYYPLRLCATAEEELFRETQKEALEIKKLLIKKGFKELAEAIVVKCQTTGFCHEENPCGQIKQLIKDYDEKFHKKILRSLEEKYYKNSNLKSQMSNLNVKS